MYDAKPRIRRTPADLRGLYARIGTTVMIEARFLALVSHQILYMVVRHAMLMPS